LAWDTLARAIGHRTPSGREAQRVKLATELQHSQRVEPALRARRTDEPTTGLHPSDVAKLMKQLDGLVDAGNTVIVVEHDMSVAAASDWIIDIGPGAGDEGGKIVASGAPEQLGATPQNRPMSIGTIRLGEAGFKDRNFARVGRPSERNIDHSANLTAQSTRHQ
jgi:ABC-type hemin transport system ATPase subunit